MTSPHTYVADGAWCWFNNPRALELDGRVTFASITSTGDAQVTQYDRNTGELATYTVQAGEPEDDHAVPSLCFLPDSRIAVFWCEHSKPNVPIQYIVSQNPNDISAWGSVRIGPPATSSTEFCYPDPVVVPEDNRLYLFWRQNVYPGPMCVSWTRLDDLVNWEPSHVLLQSPYGERPYWHVDYDGHGGINIAITDGSPNTTTNNVYFCNLHRDPKTNKLAIWDSTTLGPDHNFRHFVADGPYNVSPDNLTVIQHASVDYNGWIWDLARDANDHPVIATVGLKSPDDQYARFVTWVTGTGWVNNQITDMGGTICTEINSNGNLREPNYSPGMCLDHSDPYQVYISRMMSTGHREIRHYTTSDNGQTWAVEPITADSPQDNLRPVMPRGATDGPASLLWMAGSYAHWTDYDTAIVGLQAASGAAA